MEELTVSKPVVGYVLGGGVWTRATTLKLTDGEMPPSNSLHHDFFETLAGLGWIWGDTATGNNIDIYVTSNTRTQSDFGTKIADLVATSGSGKKATRIVIPVTRAIPQAFDKTDLPHCLVLTKSFDTLLAAEYQERGKKSGTAKQHSDRTVGVEISGADWALQALTESPRLSWRLRSLERHQSRWGYRTGLKGFELCWWAHAQSAV